MAVLAIFQPDVRAEARLSSALNGSHHVVLRPTWTALEESIDTSDVDACLIDADHPDRISASRRIAELRARFLDLAIIACLDSDRAEEYFDLGGLGVDGLVVSDERPTRVRSHVDRALARARGLRVRRLLSARLASPGPQAMAWAVEHAGPDTSVRRLASALGHTPRTLRDTLHEADLPAPGRILLHGRLLLAGARLGDDHRRVEDVAFSLGYSTATSFARAMKTHTGLTPAQLSRRGGMDVVLDALCGPAGRNRGTSGSEGKRSLMSPVSSPLCR